MDNDNQLPPAPVAEEIISTLDVSQVQVGEKLYTHPQPAVDVEALEEFLKVVLCMELPDWRSRDLSKQICNWIEEQQQ